MSQYDGFETLRDSVLFNTNNNRDVSILNPKCNPLAVYSNASAPAPIPAPTPIPIGVQIDVTQIFTSIVSAYKDIAVTSEIERTKREQARQLAKIEIARMNETTKRYEMFLNDRKETRIEFIKLISDILQKPGVEVEVVTYLKMILEFLLVDGQNMSFNSWNGNNYG